MCWNNIDPDQRLSQWSQFRKELIDTDLHSKLKSVAKYWADAPFGARTLDFYTPDTWSDPWEILYHGSFCQNSISLLIYYTLLLSSNDAYTVDIYLIDDGNDRYLVPVVDKKYVLNYELGNIVELSEIKVNIIDTFDKKIKQFV